MAAQAAFFIAWRSRTLFGATARGFHGSGAAFFAGDTVPAETVSRL
jgi:hypothetical protein